MAYMHSCKRVISIKNLVDAKIANLMQNIDKWTLDNARRIA